MLKWLREFKEYDQHEKWLASHFGWHKDEGSHILTEMVDRVGLGDPNDLGYRDRVLGLIGAMTVPDSVYGTVIRFDEPKSFYGEPAGYRRHEVPAEMVTLEAFYRHMTYLMEVRRTAKIQDEKYRRTLDYWSTKKWPLGPK